MNQVATQYKPHTDWWQAGEQRFASTAELLVAQLPDRSEVSYHFYEEGPPSATDGLYTQAAGALGGAATGSSLVALGLHAAGSALAVGPLLAGAAIGGVVGWAVGQVLSQRPSENVIHGALEQAPYRLYFQPAGSREKVELGAYSTAAVAPEVSGTSQPIWKDALHGA
ncbi:MAG: hypothetical protein AB1758_25315, partial [Candidatus Eremiobacterota bacterium]